MNAQAILDAIEQAKAALDQIEMECSKEEQGEPGEEKPGEGPMPGGMGGMGGGMMGGQK